MKILYGIKLMLLFMLVFLVTQNDVKEIDIRTETISESTADSVIALDDFNISLQELIRLIKWNRNPFLPYYSLSTEEILDADQMYSLVLKNIYYDNGQMKAMINNKIISEGDSYLDKEVTYIGETIVVLENSDHPPIGLMLERKK